MLIISLHNKSVQQERDLLSLNKDDLSLCPETVKAADFLQTMDGWL